MVWKKAILYSQAKCTCRCCEGQNACMWRIKCVRACVCVEVSVWIKNKQFQNGKWIQHAHEKNDLNHTSRKPSEPSCTACRFRSSNSAGKCFCIRYLMSTLGWLCDGRPMGWRHSGQFGSNFSKSYRHFRQKVCPQRPTCGCEEVWLTNLGKEQKNRCVHHKKAASICYTRSCGYPKS